MGKVHFFFFFFSYIGGISEHSSAFYLFMNLYKKKLNVHFRGGGSNLVYPFCPLFYLFFILNLSLRRFQLPGSLDMLLRLILHCIAQHCTALNRTALHCSTGGTEDGAPRWPSPRTPACSCCAPESSPSTMTSSVSCDCSVVLRVLYA